MRYKLADANTPRDFEFSDRLDRHQDQVIRRLKAMDADIHDVEEETEHAYRVAFTLPERDLKELADRIEDIPTPRCSRSATRSRSSRTSVTPRRSPTSTTSRVSGTHAIGHVRMATESDVDISGAHPYWAYPFSDVAVVHNGQLTNYFQWKRRLRAQRPQVPVGVRLGDHRRLPRREDERGREPRGRHARVARGARRRLHLHRRYRGRARRLQGRDGGEAARPLRGSDGLVALASEEIAIRAVVDREIDTYDPYEGEVLV